MGGCVTGNIGVSVSACARALCTCSSLTYSSSLSRWRVGVKVVSGLFRTSLVRLDQRSSSLIHTVNISMRATTRPTGRASSENVGGLPDTIRGNH